MNVWMAIGLGAMCGLSSWCGSFVSAVVRKEFTNDLYWQLPDRMIPGIIAAIVIYTW